MKFASIILLALTASVLAEPEVIQRNAKGERIWELFDYLKGTSAEIHAQLNKETDRFKAQVAEAQRAVADDKKVLEEHRGIAVAKLKERKDYQQAVADAAACKAQLEKARAGNDRDEIARLSTQYNNAREAVTRMEHDAGNASDGNRLIKGDLARMADNERKLATCKKGLADAQSWRDEIVNALHNSEQLHDPVAVGDVGILGEIIPRELRADGELACTAQIRHATPRGEPNAEGIATMNVTLIPANVTVKRSGLEAGKVRMGVLVRYDRGVKVTSVKANGDGVDLIVEVQNDEYDELMRALEP